MLVSLVFEGVGGGEFVEEKLLDSVFDSGVSAGFGETRLGIERFCLAKKRGQGLYGALFSSRYSRLLEDVRY